MTDAQLRNVHDRATRGEHLTAEEQAALEAWYLQQDQAESQLLLDHTQPEPLVHLRAQVAGAAAQLEMITHLEEQRTLLEEQRAILTLLLKRTA